MKQAQLFDSTMAALWGNTTESRVSHALASFVRTHRVNAENGFDVLRIFWPDAVMTARGTFTPETDDESEAHFDVKFPDGSTALLVSQRGICNMVEVVSLDDPAGVTPSRALTDEENQFLTDLAVCSDDLVGWATQQFGKGRSLAEVKDAIRRAMESAGRA